MTIMKHFQSWHGMFFYRMKWMTLTAMFTLTMVTMAGMCMVTIVMMESTSSSSIWHHKSGKMVSSVFSGLYLSYLTQLFVLRLMSLFSYLWSFPANGLLSTQPSLSETCLWSLTFVLLSSCDLIIPYVFVFWTFMFFKSVIWSMSYFSDPCLIFSDLYYTFLTSVLLFWPMLYFSDLLHTFLTSTFALLQSLSPTDLSGTMRCGWLYLTRLTTLRTPS